MRFSRTLAPVATFVEIYLGTLLCFFLGTLYGARPAYAYPELVRHGYVNCTSCHFAPTGGSTLTPYGRQLSGEVLSTWSYDGETKAAFLITTPDWLHLAGDYRGAYVIENTPNIEQGMSQFMQLDAGGAITYKNFTFNAFVGYQDPDNPVRWTDYLTANNYYVMYHVTDEFALRGGKFYPAYGIFTANHSLLIRDTLNIHQPVPLGDGQSYNLEVSYIGDTYNVIATGVFGRPDDPSTQRGVGATLVVSRAFADHYKAGLSYLYGTNDIYNRHVFGPYGILGFTQSLYLLSELNFQAYTPKTGPGYNPVQWGGVETSRLGYEVVRGLNLILSQEYGRLQFSNLTSLQERYGVGVWWFPTPHLEGAIEYQKRLNRAQPFASFYDYLYILWHLYI